MKNNISASQTRAARALLGWSQERLAEASMVGVASIRNFERGARLPYWRTLRDLQVALEEAGIEFIDRNGSGIGVRFKDPERRD